MTLPWSGNGPFPIASNTLQQQFARLLQDLKRTRATSDVLAAVASAFFGGTTASFALRNVQVGYSVHVQ